MDRRSRDWQNGGRTSAPTRGRIETGTAGKEVFNQMLFIGVLVGGVAAFIIDTILFQTLYRNIPNIVLFGLLMAIFTLGILGGSLASTTRYSKDFGKALLGVLVSAVIIFVAALIFEFLYELNFMPKKADTVPTEGSITDYVFCIDDSGSMGDNDSENQRYTALNDILSKLDETSNVGVIRFSDKIDQESTLQALNAEQSDKLHALIDNPSMSGGTNFKKPLKRAYEMYKKLGIEGRNQIVVLLSDGECSLNVNRMAKKYNRLGIKICTVYLGHGGYIPDVLQELANQTGGTAVSVQDADTLIQTFNEIVTTTNQTGTDAGKYSRFLWNPRSVSDQNNIWAMIIRVLFYALAGLFYGTALYMILGVPLAQQRVISPIEGIACGILMEVGFGIGLWDPLVRFAMLLMALVFANYMTNGRSTIAYGSDTHARSSYRSGTITSGQGIGIQKKKESQRAHDINRGGSESGSSGYNLNISDRGRRR